MGCPVCFVKNLAEIKSESLRFLKAILDKYTYYLMTQFLCKTYREVIRITAKLLFVNYLG